MKKYLSISAVILIVDQITKWWILGKFPYEGMSETITSFFNLVRVHNHGAAFSFLSDAGGWQRWFFTLLAIAVSGFIVWMLRKNEGTNLFKTALSLILGGAIGNVIDRLIHGYVVDFFDFHFDFLSGIFYQGHYPAFNIADSAITIGAILLIADEIKRWRATKSA